jgi:hypothetical protein
MSDTVVKAIPGKSPFSVELRMTMVLVSGMPGVVSREARGHGTALVEDWAKARPPRKCQLSMIGRTESGVLATLGSGANGAACRTIAMAAASSAG